MLRRRRGGGAPCCYLPGCGAAALCIVGARRAGGRRCLPPAGGRRAGAAARGATPAARPGPAPRPPSLPSGAAGGGVRGAPGRKWGRPRPREGAAALSRAPPVRWRRKAGGSVRTGLQPLRTPPRDTVPSSERHPQPPKFSFRGKRDSNKKQKPCSGWGWRGALWLYESLLGVFYSSRYGKSCWRGRSEPLLRVLRFFTLGTHPTGSKRSKTHKKIWNRYFCHNLHEDASTF